MPRPEYKNRRQYAVLWAKVGDDDNGQPKLAAPVEIRVRWVDKLDQVADVQNNVITFDATVKLGPNDDVPEGSILWKGKLKDFEVTNPNTYMQVVRVDSTPDVKGRRFLRTCHLARFSDKLPADIASP